MESKSRFTQIEVVKPLAQLCHSTTNLIGVHFDPDETARRQSRCGIDTDEKYLEQARFAAEVNRVDIEFHNLSVYRVAELQEKFDLVLFMGVFYHLRHPLLALELLHEHVVADLLVAQSLLRGSNESAEVPPDFHFWEEDTFENRNFPRVYFIENRFANDPTNWWILNRVCFEAMLRSAGFKILDHPEEEVFICRRTELTGPYDYKNELREITR